MAIGQHRRKIEELERRVSRLEAEMGIYPELDEEGDDE